MRVNTRFKRCEVRFGGHLALPLLRHLALVQFFLDGFQPIPQNDDYHGQYPAGEGAEQADLQGCGDGWPQIGVADQMQGKKNQIGGHAACHAEDREQRQSGDDAQGR